MGRANRLRRAVTGAWFTARLGMVAWNAATYPRLRREPTPVEVPRVSILVPARNEAHNLPDSLPGIVAQGVHEVLVLDDHSDDGTADVARRLGAAVLVSEPLPPGWGGKQWACQQLARAATGEVLLFLDADVRLAPGAVEAILAARARLDVDVLTVLPRAVDLQGGARLLTPLVENLVVATLPSQLLTAPDPRVAWGHGACLLIDADRFHALGGYTACASGSLNDVAFVRQAKTSGARVGQALGRDLVGIRMYPDYAASLAGYGKNIREVHGGSRALMALSAAWMFSVHSLPWLLPARTRSDHLLRAASLLERSLVPVVTGRTSSWWEGLLSPVTPLAALPGYVVGLRRRRTWKGRRI